MDSSRMEFNKQIVFHCSSEVLKVHRPKLKPFFIYLRLNFKKAFQNDLEKGALN